MLCMLNQSCRINPHHLQAEKSTRPKVGEQGEIIAAHSALGWTIFAVENNKMNQSTNYCNCTYDLNEMAFKKDGRYDEQFLFVGKYVCEASY